MEISKTRTLSHRSLLLPNLLNSGMTWNMRSNLRIRLFAPVGQSVFFNCSKYSWCSQRIQNNVFEKASLEIFLTTCQQTYLSNFLERAVPSTASWSQKIPWGAFRSASSIKMKTTKGCWMGGNRPAHQQVTDKGSQCPFPGLLPTGHGLQVAGGPEKALLRQHWHSAKEGQDDSCAFLMVWKKCLQY